MNPLRCSSPARVSPSASGSQGISLLREQMSALVGAGASGVVVFVRHGEDRIQLAAGAARLDLRQPMRPDDRFRVGSVTKTFVATVVLQLAGEGVLGLDDTVDHWLPGLLADGDRITVRQLLNHTSGLFDYLRDPRSLAPYLAGDAGFGWAPRALIALATSHPPVFPPGSAFGYSNTDYLVLGLIVEKATGTPLGEQLNRRLFTPLQLRATSFPSTPRVTGPHAHGYLVTPAGMQDVTAFSPSLYWAAGGLVPTAADVARFYQALLGGELLRPRLLRAMETTIPESPTSAAGLGIFTAQLPCGTFWGHSGAVGGYSSQAMSTQDGRDQAIVLVNSFALDGRVGGPAAQSAYAALVLGAFCAVHPS
jgi:D-alanyl-D-alanine carboxypeptidase